MPRHESVIEKIGMTGSFSLICDLIFLMQGDGSKRNSRKMKRQLRKAITVASPPSVVVWYLVAKNEGDFQSCSYVKVTCMGVRGWQTI